MVVRPASFLDQPAVRAVAYQTGYFGAPAGPFFPDERLFGDLWVSPYFVMGEAGFVAERAGELLGYITGATDQRAYTRALWAVVLGRIAPRVLTGRYAHPLTCLRYLLRLQFNPAPHADYGRYPAHLHVNLRPESRGLGVGGRLLGAHLDDLRARGVPGVQLSTTVENRAALALYERAGFTLHARRSTDLWTPWLGRPTVLVVMVKDLKAEPTRLG